MLDLDQRLDRHPGGLGTLGEEPPARIGVHVARVRQHDRALGQIGDADRAPQPMLVCAQVEHLVAHHGAHVEALVVDRQHDEPGLEPAGSHIFGDRRRVEAGEPDADAGIALGEVLGEVCEQVVDGRRERPERGHPGAHVTDAGDRLTRRLDAREHRLRVRYEGLSRLGQRDSASDAHEERHAELALEPADLLGERRLGQVE